jgi:uncharacterized protein YecE (DUF72 family)
MISTYLTAKIRFLDKLPTADGYDYAIEFRHPSWGTEGPWEMLRHYNIAAVMTDSPPSENLLLSQPREPNS